MKITGAAAVDQSRYLSCDLVIIKQLPFSYLGICCVTSSLTANHSVAFVCLFIQHIFSMGAETVMFKVGIIVIFSSFGCRKCYGMF